MEHKLSIALAGILGTLFSFAMDNNDILFKWFRWLPGLLSIAFILWQWRQKKRGK